MKKETFENYRYYNGEKTNPFENKDFGKSFWWRVESYAAEREDKKETEKLSQTMKTYILEHHWEGDGQPDTTREVALQRATELYHMGIWSRSYVTTNSYKLEYVILDSFS